MTATLWVLVGFLAAQLALGAWLARRIRVVDDFLVAGRKLGYPLAIASIFATWFGAETVLGSAGVAYEKGLSLLRAEPFGYGLCLLLMGAVFARPLWARKLTTLADLFRQRYSVGTERVAALLLLPSSVFWAAAQVRAFGQLLASAGLSSVELGIWVALLVSIAYTAMGGLLADAVTDLLQGTVVVLGLFALAVASWWVVPSDAKNAFLTPTWPDTSSDLDLLAILEEWSIPVLGSVLAAELVTRIIAARSSGVAKRATLAAGGLYLAIGLIPLGLGILGSELLPGLEDPEQVIPQLAKSLLPGWGQAVFAAALAAAILSTLDSTLLVASGLAVENLLPHRVGISAEGRFRLVLVRVGVVGFGLLAALLAHSSSGILGLVEQASALGSSGVLVCGVFGLFTRWGGSCAAIVALVGGMASYVTGVWSGFPYPYLLSLGSAFAGYVAGVAVERAWSRWGIGHFARQRS